MSEENLELRRGGTRFTSDATERRFRAWQFARTLPLLRLQHLVTMIVFTTTPAAVVALGVVAAGEAAVVWLVVAACMGIGAAALWRRSGVWWRFFLLVPGTVVAMTVIVAIGLHPEIDPALPLVIGSMAGLTIAASTEGVWISAPAALTSVMGSIALLTQRTRAGELSVEALAIESLCMFVSIVIGWVISLNTDRAARTAYQQERIIEEQKATIARERAEREELLQRELSHQVAERSRELGAAFAKSDATLDVRALHPGERFAERYKIVAPMGSGAFGAVYEVERVTDGEKLALKAVVGEVSGSAAARFAREAEIGARVRHPNVIPIVDVGVAAGVPYLVMELVRGGSLEAQRDRFGDVEWALPILKQIAEGLAALHDAGVVHRDLKPANVLLAKDGAKISDFGISRLGEHDSDGAIDPAAATIAASKPRAALVTGTGVILGTPMYMAPEAARGGKTLDAAADAFSFGILAYEMLTGRAPFEIPAFLLALADTSLPSPAPLGDARIPAHVRTLVLECLALDPAKRPRMRTVLSAVS